MKRFTSPLTGTVRRIFSKERQWNLQSPSHFFNIQLELFPYADKSDGDSDFQSGLNKFHLKFHISWDI